MTNPVKKNISIGKSQIRKKKKNNSRPFGLRQCGTQIHRRETKAASAYYRFVCRDWSLNGRGLALNTSLSLWIEE
jgi:hypothetical protein